MAHNDTTSAVVDTVLKIAVTGTALTTGLLIPNAMIALEKQLDAFLNHMDKRERQREARRIISYMKSQGLLKGKYEHGLKITAKGRLRLASAEFDNLAIGNQKQWDHIWRLVFYDVPEQYRSGRQVLTAKLQELGFFQLQQSVWIHPFPCREVVERVTTNFNLERYVSYIETTHLDNETALIKRFSKRLPTTSFK